MPTGTMITIKANLEAVFAEDDAVSYNVVIEGYARLVDLTEAVEVFCDLSKHNSHRITQGGNYSGSAVQHCPFEVMKLNFHRYVPFEVHILEHSQIRRSSDDLNISCLAHV